MKNSDYWKQRFTQLEAAQNSIGIDALADIEKQYRQARQQIEAKISTWYQRFALNNSISMSEARKWLTGKELKEFKWDVKDYISYGEENALNGKWIKELENASAKFHISRLEALKIHTEQSMQAMFAKQQGVVSEALRNVFTSGYYHTAYELQKGFNIGFDIAAVDQNYLESVLVKPWAVDGKDFSSRIWGSRDKLIAELHNELSQNIITGSDPQKAINAISKKLNVSKSNAGRLVITEEAYFSSAAQQKCFEDLDVEEYEIVATLDSHTSEICQSLDGQHFSMKDFEAGVTAPPFHPNCRSTTAPYFSENFGQIGERAARDENGEVYYVPDDMTYKEWKEKYVKKEVAKTRESDIIKAGERITDNKTETAKYVKFDTADNLNKSFLADEEKGFVSKLTQDEKDALLGYSSEGYDIVNTYLRENGYLDEFDINIAKEIDEQLDTVISKFDLKDNLTVYRATTLSAFDEDDVNFLIGKEFSDKAYMSSTPLYEAAKAFGDNYNKSVMLEINLKSGKGKGAYINSLSVHKDEEYEFLIQKNKKFKIVHVSNKDDYVYVRLEEL